MTEGIQIVCSVPGCGLPDRLHGAEPGEHPTRSTHAFRPRARLRPHEHDYVPISAFGARCACGDEQFAFPATFPSTRQAAEMRRDRAEFGEELRRVVDTEAERLHEALGLPADLTISFSREFVTDKSRPQPSYPPEPPTGGSDGPSS